MSEKKPAHEKVASVAPFGLRMLPDLKQRIADAAAANNRSMNAEITERLELSFSPYADPEAVAKAYESGRRDALLASEPLIGSLTDDDRASESMENARILFDALPPASKEAIIPLIKLMVPAGKSGKSVKRESQMAPTEDAPTRPKQSKPKRVVEAVPDQGAD